MNKFLKFYFLSFNILMQFFTILERYFFHFFYLFYLLNNDKIAKLYLFLIYVHITILFFFIFYQHNLSSLKLIPYQYNSTN